MVFKDRKTSRESYHYNDFNNCQGHKCIPTVEKQRVMLQPNTNWEIKQMNNREKEIIFFFDFMCLRDLFKKAFVVCNVCLFFFAVCLLIVK